MENFTPYIESGILESYLLGELKQEERREVERMAAAHPQIRQELDRLEEAQIDILNAGAVQPSSGLRNRLFEKLSRLEKEEKEDRSRPPFLNAKTTRQELEPWLEQAQAPPADFENLYFDMVFEEEGFWTSVVWVKKEIPHEKHSQVLENFYVVEGSCVLYMDGKEWPLQAGDFFQIPLYKEHFVEVTSDVPCKILMQRIAA